MPPRSATPPGRSRVRRAGGSAARGLLCLLVLATPDIPGCDKVAERFHPKKAWQTFETSDGRAAIRVPSGWRKMSRLNPEASLEAFRPPGTRMTVFSEAKGDFDSFEHREYAIATRAIILSNMRTTLGGSFKVIRELDAESIRVGFYRAYRAVIEAELRGIPLWLLYVCIEGPRYVHQIVFHVPDESWERQRASLEEIIASFRERAAPLAPPSPRPVEPFKIAKARDRCGTLGVPKNWVFSGQDSPNACIAEKSPMSELGVLVLQEAKVDLDVDSLRGYLELSLKTMKSDMDYKGFNQEEIREGRIGGLPALRVVMRASMAGVKTVQEIVTVQSRDYYYRLHTIALPSLRSVALPMFERILQSFRPAPDAPPPRSAAREAPSPRPASTPVRIAPSPPAAMGAPRIAPRPRPR